MSGNRYLLDSTVFVDYFRKVPVAHQIILDKLAPSVMAGYSIVTEAELWAGVRRLRTEESHVVLLKPFVRFFVNVTIARRAGLLKADITVSSPKNTSLPGLSDCIIAATAEYHQLTIVTRNTNHFELFTNYGIDVTFYSR